MKIKLLGILAVCGLGLISCKNKGAAGGSEQGSDVASADISYSRASFCQIKQGSFVFKTPDDAANAKNGIAIRGEAWLSKTTAVSSAPLFKGKILGEKRFTTGNLPLEPNNFDVSARLFGTTPSYLDAGLIYYVGKNNVECSMCPPKNWEKLSTEKPDLWRQCFRRENNSNSFALVCMSSRYKAYPLCPGFGEAHAMTPDQQAAQEEHDRDVRNRNDRLGGYGQ